MKPGIILVALMLVPAAAVGMSGCTDEAHAGAIREDGGLRVVLNDTGAAANGGAIWVDLTVENAGSTPLFDFETYLGVLLQDAPQVASGADQEYRYNKYIYSAFYKRYLYPSYASVCEGEVMQPGMTANEVVQIWDIAAMGNIVWGEKPLLIIRATSSEGMTVAVDFTIPQPEDKCDWGW